MKNSIYTIMLLGAVSNLAVAQTPTQNYVETVTYLNKAGTDSIVSIQYFDGLGRLDQTVTGGANTNGLYLHARTEYDGCGRESVLWSPVIGDKTPDYISPEDFVSRSRTTYDGDQFAFSTMQYDGLDRKTFVSTPGKAWQGKGKRQVYRTNQRNEVRQYTMDDLKGSQYYDEGLLSCTESIDEDSIMTLVFADFLGRTILERRPLAEGNCDTYYVYDDLGRLSVVLPPMYHQNPSSQNLDLYAFQYEYDLRGNVTMKKLPGCKPIQYWYDEADRVVRMQDGVLAEHNKYRIYAYDKFDRMTSQSISADGKTVEYDEIINFYDNYKFLDDPKYAALIPDNIVDDTDLQPLQRNDGSGLLTGIWQRASNGEPMLMTRSYDDHGRLVLQKEIGLGRHLNALGYYYDFVGNMTYEAGDLYLYSEKEKALAENKIYAWESKNYYGSSNKLLQNSVIHLNYAKEKDQTCDVIESRAYNDLGQVIANDRKGTAGDMTYAYDQLHGWLTGMTASAGFRQNLFRENSDADPRFNGSIAAMSWSVGDNYNRTYHYEYDQMNRLLTAEYSAWQGDWKGAKTPELRTLIPMCNTQDGDYSAYFEYDLNTNITRVERYGTSNSTAGVKIDDLTLNYQGNLLRSVHDYSEENLTYSGAFDYHDKTNYSIEFAYDGNGALTKDLNKGISKIEYDLLGRPRRVLFKNLNNIEYVYAADGRKLKTIHSTAFRMRVSSGNNGRLPGYTYVYTRDTTDYINNYVFENGIPKMYRFDGGYYSFDKEGELDGCHFYVQDYQGNNRMVVNAETAEVEQISHYYPYGALMGDISTNQDLQKYHYSGKEIDRKFGLDWYDFHARQQDPLIPRFNSVDPLATDYFWISPYAYCMGNPVNCIDPDGRSVWTKIGKFALKVGKKVAKEGFSSLKKGSTYADAFSDVIDDVRTIASPVSTPGEKALSGLSLASEALPVSVSDVKDARKVINRFFKRTSGSAGTKKARFIVDEKGRTVDTSTTPKGTYVQPNGDETDILQDKRHFNKSTQQYDGQSHTHPHKINVNPSGNTYSGRSKVTHEPTFEEVQNITNGTAIRKK